MSKQKKGNKFTHSELVKIGKKYLERNTSCGVVLTELKTAVKEIPDVIGFGSGCLSILIEVKASRSDFLKDKKKEFRQTPEEGMGSKRFYLCPNNIIKEHELPEGWGLIYVNEKGKARCVSGNPKHLLERKHPDFNKNLRAEWNLMYSVMRRLTIKGYINEIYDNRKDYLED